MTARILVVDDIPANAKLLQAKLEAEYFEVLLASDGPEAIEKANELAPDIILLDVMMPGMDGFEACRRLKTDPRTRLIPVVMVTALSNIADRVRGLEAGADDFLSKPVNDVALFARVRSLARLKMMMDELRVRRETFGQLGELADDTWHQEDDFAGSRIAVIENDPFTRAKLLEILASADYEGLAIADPQAAAMAAAEGPLDLITVGMRVGGEDGLRICSQLRSQEETRHVPILLVLDEIDLPQLARGLDIGVTDYLIKPIDRGEMLARTRTQIRRRRYHDHLRATLQTSVSMAYVDPLTGVYNRRYMTAHLERQVAAVRSGEKPVSLAILDVDHFKAINDLHGHSTGDQVLCILAERLSEGTRSSDLVARYGGEEFVAIMPGTPGDIAVRVAERLRRSLAANPFSLDGPACALKVTASFGVATLKPGEETADELMKRADQALYEAKKAGRNRVFSAEAGLVTSSEAHSSGEVSNADDGKAQASAQAL